MEQDKRQHPRIPCAIESTYQDFDGKRAESATETQVKDLSEGGVRFRVSRFIGVQNKLLFRLRLPNQKTIEVVAQPAWVREIPSVNQFEVGAKFLSISDADRSLIRRYIQNF